MNNLDFFKSCFAYELTGTLATFNSLPPNALSYRPHEKNKTAREQIAHLLGHINLFFDILRSNSFEEQDENDFLNNYDAAIVYEERAKKLLTILDLYEDAEWENETVQLMHDGKPVMEMPRFRMMWVFLFDTIHHRAQLSTYIRPMGGKNPAIYGSSADTK